MDGEKTPVSPSMAQFGFTFFSAEGYPCFVSKRRERILVACHPLLTLEYARASQ